MGVFLYICVYLFIFGLLALFIRKLSPSTNASSEWTPNFSALVSLGLNTTWRHAVQSGKEAGAQLIQYIISRIKQQVQCGRTLIMTNQVCSLHLFLCPAMVKEIPHG